MRRSGNRNRAAVIAAVAIQIQVNATGIGEIVIPHSSSSLLRCSPFQKHAATSSTAAAAAAPCHRRDLQSTGLAGHSRATSNNAGTNRLINTRSAEVANCAASSNVEHK